MTLAASTSSEVPGATTSAARLASTTPRPPGVTGRQRHHHHQGVRRHAEADTCCVAARDKDRVIGLLADQQRLLASTALSVLANNRCWSASNPITRSLSRAATQQVSASA